MKTLRKTPILWALTGLLAACGNNGGAPTPSGNQLPEVSVKLTDGSAVSNTTYFSASERLIFSASDADGTVTKVKWVIDAGRVGERSGEYTGADVKGKLDFALPNLSSGGHTLNLNVTDNAGGLGSAAFSFKVDAEAPVISGVNINGSAISEGQALSFSATDSATLTVSATDVRGGGDTSPSPTAIRIYVGDAQVGSAASAPRTLDLAALLKGVTAVSTVRLVALDSAGNVSATRSFTVQFAAAATAGGTGVVAEPTLTWLAPTGDFVRGGGTITLRASAIKAGQDISGQVSYSVTCGAVVGSSWNLGTDCTDGSKQTVTANLTDGGKNYTISKTITVDASDPTVQITSPQQGQSVTVNPVNVAFTATDSGSGIDHVDVTATDAGGVRQVIGTVNTASGTVVWAPQNGTYTLTAVAYDKVGRTATTSLGNVKVQLTSTDNQAPSVTTLTLATGPQRGVVTVTAAVTDPSPSSGLAKVELFEGGTSLGVQTAGVAAGLDKTYTFSLDTSKLIDGTHTIRAVVTDNVGLSGEKVGTLSTDNTAPLVNWQSPQGSVVGQKVTLNATTSEGAVSYTVDGAAVSDIDPAVSGFQVILSDGPHTLVATARDAAGNSASATLTVTADGTAPTVSILTPAANTTLTQNPVTVTVAASDALSGVDRIVVSAVSGGVTTVIGTVSGSQGSVTWVPSSGAYTLKAVSYDKAGNASPEAGNPVTVTLATTDTTPPVSTTAPSLTPAATNGFSRRTVAIDGSVRDAESGVSQVALFDGGLRLAVQPSLSTNPPPDGGTRYAFQLDTGTLADGPHALRVQATNGVGLTTDVPVTVSVNNAAPVVNVTRPADGAVLGLSGDYTVAASASDATPGDTLTLTYSIDNGAFVASAPSVPTTDGIHTVAVRATDGAGNVTTAVSTVTVDRTPPVVSVLSPVEGANLTQNLVTVQVSATDTLSGVNRIELKEGLTVLGTVTGSQGSVSYAFPNGNHTLTVTATDKAGNSSSVTRTISVTTSSTIVPSLLTVTASGSTGSNPQFVRGLGSVTGTATSSTSTGPIALASAQLIIDGAASGTPSGAGNGSSSFNFDFSTLNEGLHDFGLRWQDSAGTVADSAKLSVYVDKTAPTVVWNRPANGSVTSSSTITLDATATDAASGVASITYSESGTAISTPANWTPAEGAHTVTATATDRVGNSSSQNITLTVDRSAPVITATSPANTQEFTTAPVTISATAIDSFTSVRSIEATIQGPKDISPITLGVQNGEKYSAVYTPVDAGTYTVNFIAFDILGNQANPVTRAFSYSVTTVPQEKAPTPVLSVIGNGPYTGNMSVNVSGGFDSLGQADRVILEIRDKNGVIDNTTYSTGQAQATFSVDTTKFANGSATLQVIAYTKSGLRGLSALTTIRVQNILNPVIAVASPSNGATVSSPTVPVKVTITRNGDTDYTLTPATLLVELVDYRGQVIAKRTNVPVGSINCVASADSATYTCNTSFDVAGLPADTYTLRATVQTTVSGATPPEQTLTTESRFTSNTVSVNPPAATISFPTAVTLADNSRVPAKIDSGSGFFATVSDNVKIQYVEARLVGPYLEGNIEADGTRQCQSSGSVVSGESEINVLVLNVPGTTSAPYQVQEVFIPQLDVSGSTYVPDSKTGQRYDLRVTTADNEGNRNIQCVPVKVDRNLVRPTYSTSNSTTPGSPSIAPGELTYTSGTWTLSSVPANSRVVAVIYAGRTQIGTEFFSKTTGAPINVSTTFSDVGTYSISWLIEDMSSVVGLSNGVVTTQNGGYINVSRNAK